MVREIFESAFVAVLLTLAWTFFSAVSYGIRDRWPVSVGETVFTFVICTLLVLFGTLVQKANANPRRTFVSPSRKRKW